MKVLIIGGGASGMMAALVAAQDANNRVTLLERQARVGRKLLATSASYQLVFPTLVLSIITISFYIIGNAFADAADPKNHL